MQELIGTSNRVLEIDLTAKKFEVTEISKKDLEMYLGGKGIGLKLLYDRMQPGVDPLGPDNMIAITMGVILGSGAPCSGRFEAVTKSPAHRHHELLLVRRGVRHGGEDLGMGRDHHQGQVWRARVPGDRLERRPVQTGQGPLGKRH